MRSCDSAFLDKVARGMCKRGMWFAAFQLENGDWTLTLFERGEDQYALTLKVQTDVYADLDTGRVVNPDAVVSMMSAHAKILPPNAEADYYRSIITTFLQACTSCLKKTELGDWPARLRASLSEGEVLRGLSREQTPVTPVKESGDGH